MDELISDFIIESGESLEQIDAALVAFEQHPKDQDILRQVFRLVHTIKGTCGFLELTRLEALTHAAENLMGRYRDGLPPTDEGVNTILTVIDQIKAHLDHMRAHDGAESDGNDQALIDALNRLAEEGTAEEDQFGDQAPFEGATETTAAPQPLDPLEEAFRNAPGPDDPLPMPAEPDAAASAPVAKPAKDPTAGTPPQGAIRVQLGVLEQLMTMVSELVLTRNQLMAVNREFEDARYHTPLQRLCSVTAELQDGVMKTRMQPISALWQKMPRIVRDLGKELGKQISLEMSGEETELDRQVLEQIKDPLTHMIRNAADHGLEEPGARVAAGKPEMGKIEMNAFHKGGQIVIEIRDDGRGLDAKKLKQKAQERGLANPAELDAMSDSQAHQLIFHPGFSTAEAVTSVSGRGVGMDVVRTNVEMIGGTIELQSSPGEGTLVSLNIPLTLAIVPALIVASHQERFAVPQRAVRELVRIAPKQNRKVAVQNEEDMQLEWVNGAQVLQLRDQLLPVLRLDEALGVQTATDNVDGGFVVVLEIGAFRFGLLVDAVFHTEEIVVKPMVGALKELKHFSGTTILGDGSVIMILDAPGLAAQVTQSELNDHGAQQDMGQDQQGEDRVELLCFILEGAGRKAVPLSLIHRLELVDLSQIEQVGGRYTLQYTERLMPIVFLRDQQMSDLQRSRQKPLLVFEDHGFMLGIAVDQVLDICKAPPHYDLDGAGPGYLGSAILDGKATEILDLAHFMAQEHPKLFERQGQTATPQRQKLLYAEDSAFFRNMLVPIFQSAGYEVTVCHDGQEAVERVQGGEAYDLIVTDIEMPRLDGFGLAKSIADAPHAAQTPIIALTSYDEPAARDQAKALGMSAYIAKNDRARLDDTLSQMRNRMDRDVA
ncbi:hybrid sensor histidine kinase/response regulator [Maritalea mediterranea]|uniref:histidine kinase n=1 Tax=Maritalea mediterranea TaxID=2909667 RepID=A0ABS9ED77_9HYPH|nr:hybrid sensor histidine kinase/response regulator [Maritalea mediterranea]MCF4099720.1 hybrid sensor histidine kinase/response regulator [Maritalea mediterranea]